MNCKGEGPQSLRFTPDPSHVRSARQAAGLTQTASAAIVHSTCRAWQLWEAGDRKMHPASWELFNLKINTRLMTQTEEARQRREQEIFDQAPLFYRLTLTGYFDAEDAPTPEEIAIDLEVERSLGIKIPPPQRIFPPIHHWGIECGDGWLSIVRQASVAIESVLHDLRADGVATDDLPAATQIKEKFGELRIGVRGIAWRGAEGSGPAARIRRTIEGAQDSAQQTCEGCGARGVLRKDGWLIVLCMACNAN